MEILWSVAVDQRQCGEPTLVACARGWGPARLDVELGTMIHWSVQSCSQPAEEIGSVSSQANR